MRIEAIAIENFLSFEATTPVRLDPTLTVFVGPNGAGKTNLFHAVRAVHDVVHRLATPFSPGLGITHNLPVPAWEWHHIRHRGNDTRPSVISLDVTLTTPHERNLLTMFIVAAFLHPQAIQEVITREHSRSVSPAGLRAFASWLERHVPPAIEWMLTGQLTISSRDGGERWECQYSGRIGADPFWWDLRTPGIRGVPVTSGAGLSSLFGGWRDTLSPEQRSALDRALMGELDELGKQKTAFPDTLDLNALPRWGEPHVDKPLGTAAWNVVEPMPPLLQRLASEFPPPWSGWQMSGSHVWDRILGEALVVTDNVRVRPETDFTASQLQEERLHLEDGRDLGAFLYRLKTGDSTERAAYAAVQATFRRLTTRTIEIQEERPHALYRTASDASIPRAPTQDGEQLRTLRLVVAEQWGDVPLAFSGAGIAEALYLSTLVSGSSGQIVLLDEPSLHLHPTLIATLLEMLQEHDLRTAAVRSQFLVSTHSPWLVPPDGINRVVRLTQPVGHTVVHALDPFSNTTASTAAADQVIDLRQLLRRDPSARALLFARAVVLVEGETELGALPIWWTLAERDIALYSVGGRGNFVGPIKLLERFAIPWVVLCDGDALWDRKQHSRTHPPDLHIRDILQACHRRTGPVSGHPADNTRDFARWRTRLGRFGIFSLAEAPEEGFERALQRMTPATLWQAAHDRFGDNKVAAGRFVAEGTPCPTPVRQLYDHLMHYLETLLLHSSGAAGR